MTIDNPNATYISIDKNDIYIYIPHIIKNQTIEIHEDINKIILNVSNLIKFQLMNMIK